MPLLSRLTYIGIAKEVALGTPVAPTLFIPCTMVKPNDRYNYVPDDGLRGNPTKLLGMYQAEVDGMFDFDGFLYPEVIGFLMVATGLADVVTGTTPNFTHTFKIPAAGTQPPTYTITHFDAVEARAYPGMILDTLDVTVDAKGAMKYAAKFKGWKSAAAATPTPTFTTSPSLLGWEVAANIGGGAVPRVEQASFQFKRNSQVIHTLNNTQQPYTSFAGPFEASMKFKSIMETNAELNHYLTNDQPAMLLTTTAPTGGPPAPVFTFSMAKGVWKTGLIDTSKEYVSVDADIEGVYNATDLGAASATLLISQATAY